MQIIVKTAPEELLRARKWWQDLEMQWKFAYNEAVFGKGPSIEPPRDEELMLLLIQADTLRFAGPLAQNPNISNPLTNLSGLVPLYHLKYLSLTHMKITGLTELKRHTQMEYLFVYDNQLKSLDGIENMFNLKDLYFQNNDVTDLMPIARLTNLQTLYASNNNISKINGLSEKHGDHLCKFYILPNENLSDREIIRTQNEIGIICRTG
ncbi:MAG: hypothetical protein KDC85_10205 [Saprospiraceae bacterium]|nr:hypothetical protein [Saprospiraceae bacterium]MCB9323693.1 hypothetical protein [Lewinellaceae bacterium]